MFTRADKLRATKLSRLDFISFTYKIIASFAECCLRFLSKELAKLLYLSGRSMCRMKNAVSWDFVQNLCLAIKAMFSTTTCVCNLGSLKIHLFFLSERWYKLWLKVAINCFSNTRFTSKIIFALYIWHFKAGKVYKLKLFRYFSQWFYIS